MSLALPRGRALPLGDEALVMGVVNLTPDSFFAPSRRRSAREARDAALAMAAAGAAVVDLGGESTRPGSEPVGEEEELERVIPAIQAIRRESDIPLSVDTRKLAVARAARDAGADILNDVAALAAPGMAELAAERGAAAVLMHMKGEPKTMQEAPSYEDCPAEVFAFLLGAARRAEAAGIGRDRIVLDPGIGFGKRLGDNLELPRPRGPLAQGLRRRDHGPPRRGPAPGQPRRGLRRLLRRREDLPRPRRARDARRPRPFRRRPRGGPEAGMSFGQLASLVSAYVRPALDVLVLAYILYKTYEVLVRTQAIQLVKGALVLAAVYAVALFLQLTTVAWILNILAPGLVIALAIVFQPELRKIVMRLGRGSFLRGGSRPRVTQIEAALTAAELLASQRRGALMVFARNVGLKNIVDTGTRLDALLSSSLVTTIFGHDTPLHDGAIVVQDGRIAAAGCFLPLSEQQDIRKSFGTRHRAALGLSEESDAVVLVVSEETGAISLAYESKLYYGLSLDQARRRLGELLEFPAQDEAEAEEAPLAD